MELPLHGGRRYDAPMIVQEPIMRAKARKSRLARVHFWLLNLALPVMMVALSLLLFGRMAVAPVLAAGEIVAALGIAAFAATCSST